ncbi:MAG: sugar O-acetyltransferase [Cardiobacteriaceae bacterium]|nr:sugar O-acetyltransferase [Cardiobacteriaceae bacterium]
MNKRLNDYSLGLYDSNTPEIRTRRLFAKEACFRFNHLPPSAICEQEQIIRELFKKTGKNFEITAPFYCDYGDGISIGENFYSNHNLVILDAAEVVFGDNIFVAPNCGFYTAAHPLDRARRNLGLEYAKAITVGNSVWIGAGVRVLAGVNIGEGSVIAAGAVVNRDIPAGVLAAGVPCRVIREIDEEAEKLRNYL